MNWTDWHIPLSSGNITLRQGLESPAEKSVHGNMKFHSSAAGHGRANPEDGVIKRAFILLYSLPFTMTYQPGKE
jgi:hypothetical protein